MTEGASAYTLQAFEDFKSGDRRYLPHLYAQLATEKHVETRRQYTQAIAAFFLKLSAQEVIALSEDVRSTSSMLWGVDWKIISPATFCSEANTADAQFALLAIGSFHPSGFYREKCMWALHALGVRALPYLILLTNHWVKAIRDNALLLSQELICKASAQSLIGCLPYLEKVQQGARRDESMVRKLRSLIKQYLAAQFTQVSLNFLLTQEARTRRLYYGIAPADSLEEPDLILLLSKDTDSFNKLVLTRILLKNKALSEQTMRALLHFPIASVRYAAIKKKCQSHDDAGADAWDGASVYLIDKSRSIREYIRFYLRCQGQIDFVSFYEAALKETPTPGAVLGLGEVGKVENAVQVKTFLQNSAQNSQHDTSQNASPAMVHSAIAAVGMLCGSDEAPLYYGYLLGEDRSNANAAFKIIRRQYIRYDCKQCYEDLMHTPYAHTRKYLCHLVTMGTPWARLPFLIDMLNNADEKIRETALNALSTWSPGYAAPTAQECVEVEKAFSQSKLSKEVRGNLRFQVQPHFQI